MRASKGFRRGTRVRLRSSRRTTVNDRLRSFTLGEKTSIVINPSVHEGMPHPRYQGRVGVIKDRRGKAYVVDIKDGDKNKSLVVYPEHLKPITA